MTERRIEDMTDGEIATLDHHYEGDRHPSEVDAMVANDEGVIGGDIPEEAYDRKDTK